MDVNTFTSFRRLKAELNVRLWSSYIGYWTGTVSVTQKMFKSVINVWVCKNIICCLINRVGQWENGKFPLTSLKCSHLISNKTLRLCSKKLLFLLPPENQNHHNCILYHTVIPLKLLYKRCSITLHKSLKSYIQHWYLYIKTTISNKNAW